MSEQELAAEAYGIYQQGGQYAVREWADLQHPELKREWCKPCEDYQPMIGQDCAVCGTRYEPLSRDEMESMLVDNVGSLDLETLLSIVREMRADEMKKLDDEAVVRVFRETFE